MRVRAMAKRRRPRGLSKDDLDVWNRVARTADPLHPTRGRAAEGVTGSTPPKAGDTYSTASPFAKGASAPQATPSPSVPPDMSGLPLPRFFRPSPEPTPERARTSVTMAPRVGPVGRPEAGLDRRTAERLRRGDIRPDARIDLHGMTRDRAHRSLGIFLSSAIAEGRRVVLVITGKGRSGGHHEDAAFMTPARGVLREDLPRWLRTGPFASRIVGIYQAHQRHGGGGAFYVYLKKTRGG